MNISYIGQANRAISHYKDFICSDDTLMIGDFNSNQIWDKKRTIGNHTDVVNNLKQIGLVSLYHELNNEKYGSESKSTFYMNRKYNKPYHIDYLFAPVVWLGRVKAFELAYYKKWSHLSDHAPLFVEFE